MQPLMSNDSGYAPPSGYHRLVPLTVARADIIGERTRTGQLELNRLGRQFA